MHEIIVNLHMHTRYSDGSGTHQDIVQAAFQTGLDVVIVTDHNVLVQGLEGYQGRKDKRVLLLIGQEIHDQDRDPQKNHLLVFNAGREMATLADDPQALINAVRNQGGLSFIAHPVDPEAPAFGESDISWVNWEVDGFTGLELWNAFSEFKTVLKSKLHGLFYAFFPEFIAYGPNLETLRIWDEFLAKGKHISAIGGSDAHALHQHLGPIQRVIFPYKFHFRSINTHLLIPQPLTGDLTTDQRMIYEALSIGRGFIGYDLSGDTRGFRFSAQGRENSALMGEEIQVEGGITLQIHLPGLASEIRLFKDGQLFKNWRRVMAGACVTTEPGVYRVEIYKNFLGRKRGWIFSNPIYLR